MKSFKSFGRSPKSGHSFPSSFGFTSSSGKVRSISGYTQRVAKIHKSASSVSRMTGEGAKSSGVLKRAEGGAVPGRNMDYEASRSLIGDQGNSATLRSDPATELDKDYGGTSPLRPGFKKGGKIHKSKMRKSWGGSTNTYQGPPPSYYPPPEMGGPGGYGGGYGGPKTVNNPPPAAAVPARSGPAQRPGNSTIARLVSRLATRQGVAAKAKGGKIGPVKEGALHKALGISSGSKIPAKALQKAKNSDSGLMRKRANFAINAKKWNHKAKGGAVYGAGSPAKKAVKPLVRGARKGLAFNSTPLCGNMD